MKGRRARITTTAAVLALAVGRAAAAPAIVPPIHEVAAVSQTVVTLLEEVGRDAVGGREFLTLQVARPVGPSACRGAVLRVDALALGDPARRERIETVALSALLGEESVSITVPLDAARCTGGKPAFTDVRPLPPRP